MIFGPINLRVLNVISRMTNNIGSRARMLISFSCFLFIGLVFSLFPRSVYDERRMALISVLTVVLTAMCAGGEIKPVRWNKLPVLALELFALNMIIIRLIHPVGQGYMVYAVDILFLFPMLYTALLNRKDQTWFIDLMSYAVTISGTICFAYSLIIAGDDGEYLFIGRVMGVVKNPNYYGMIGLALVISGLYNIARDHDNTFWKVMASISTGIGISMIVASVSRTAMLAMVACAAAFFIFTVRADQEALRHKESPLHPGRKWLLVALAIVLVVAISAFAAVRLHKMIFAIPQNGDTMGALSNCSVSVITEVYAEDGVNEQPEETQAGIEGRFSTSTDIDTFSSGRISIWKRYSEHFNFTGNDFDAAKESGMFDDLNESRAHNNIIDYTFRFGIPAGLLYSVFYIAVIIISLIKAFGRKRFTACDLWVVMIAAAYVIYGMIEISTLPFTRYMPCLFFLSIAPLMAEPPAEE